MNGYTLKILAFLLDYPSREHAAASGSMAALLRRENWLTDGAVEALSPLLKAMGESDLLDLQEDYVALFDRTPSLSLHLFEHVHGDSRDRGQALVELDSLYREKGLENSSEHTPDYLPLFLEYLALLPVEEAKENLAGAIDVIAVIGERLKKRQSPYAALFDALRDVVNQDPDFKKLQSAIKADPGLPLSAEAMDKAWEEQFAFAEMKEGQDSGCPKAEEMLARMGIPATDKETRP